jgi:hypothetical protein
MTRPYKGRLTLDRISQPYLSAGGGALGGFFRAGVSFSFSDLLQEQQVTTAVQAGGRVQDFAVQSAYVNRESRWSWGVAGAQLPAAFTRTVTGSEAVDGRLLRERTTLRQTHRQATLLTSYPFSRSRRVEFTGGLHRVSFARDVRSQWFDAVSRSLVEEREASAAAAPPITLFEAAAAFVHDTSVHGPTGPVLGGRTRLEVAPTFGNLTFVTVTADDRRYFMPARPATLAVRLQHVGRYGADGADPRLLPLVWTLRDLVRGYRVREAAPDGCGGAASSCNLLGEFTARQLLVMNVEVRVPLLGPTGTLSRASGLPIDAIAFADAGAFWSRARPDAPASVRTLRSAGAGVRLNAGGFVFEVTAARPFDRGSGWTTAFNFRPGY